MKEVEVLVRVVDGNTKDLVEKLRSMTQEKGVSQVNDIYYYDPLRDNLKPNSDLELKEAFRIREKSNICYITYKVDRFDENGNWLYSDESETRVDNYNEIKEIVCQLGFKKLVVVNMVKYFFETTDYKIALEAVANLGMFLEVESKNINVTDVHNERQKINQFIRSLEINVTDDVGIGKPELLLKKVGVCEG